MANRAKVARREAVLRKLAKLPPAVRSRLKQALAQSADELEAMQKALVPVKTGNLRASIGQQWGGGRMRYSSLAVGVQGGDPDLTVSLSAGDDLSRVAHLVEFGTKPHINKGKFAGTKNPGTKPRPFFYPPYRANKRRIKNRIARAATQAAKMVAAGK